MNYVSWHFFWVQTFGQHIGQTLYRSDIFNTSGWWPLSKHNRIFAGTQCSLGAGGTTRQSIFYSVMHLEGSGKKRRKWGREGGREAGAERREEEGTPSSFFKSFFTLWYISVISSLITHSPFMQGVWPFQMSCWVTIISDLQVVKSELWFLIALKCTSIWVYFTLFFVFLPLLVFQWCLSVVVRGGLWPRKVSSGRDSTLCP